MSTTKVEKIKRTCGNCGHKFETRKFQRRVRCPKCKGSPEPTHGVHQGAGLFLRISEEQKDGLERMAYDTGRSQADLLREAVDLLFQEYP